MRNPSDLQVFHLAEALVYEVYRLTAAFPSDERFGLTQQIRRAAVSVPSNIVEGCTRTSQTDYRRFIEIATGSAAEARYQLGLSKGLGFAPGHDGWPLVSSKADSLVKALIALGKALRQDPAKA